MNQIITPIIAWICEIAWFVSLLILFYSMESYDLVIFLFVQKFKDKKKSMEITKHT